ncbi:hypothetical protein SNEBB_006378, partial [Seison nebaliae]
KQNFFCRNNKIMSTDIKIVLNDSTACIKDKIDDGLEVKEEVVPHLPEVKIPELVPSLDRTPLKDCWAFWHGDGDTETKTNCYEDSLTCLGAFQSVERFWSLYRLMLDVDKIKVNADIQLFKHDIHPIWEHKKNSEGGKWYLKIQKSVTSTLWKRLVLACIGNQFTNSDEICGVVFGCRSKINKLFIWTKSCNSWNRLGAMAIDLINLLRLPDGSLMQYKAHHGLLPIQEIIDDQRYEKYCITVLYHLGEIICLPRNRRSKGSLSITDQHKHMSSTSTDIGRKLSDVFIDEEEPFPIKPRRKTTTDFNYDDNVLDDNVLVDNVLE